MPDPLTAMPDVIRKGDSFSVRYSNSEFPAGTWTLTCYIVGTTNNTSVVATASGTDHILTFTTSITGALTAEFSSWEWKVDDGADERITVDNGTITVDPDFATVGASDQRSHNRIVYDAVCAVIEGRATTDQEEYTIKDRSLKRTSLEDLLKLKNYYASLVAKEERADKGQGNRLVKIRFGNP